MAFDPNQPFEVVAEEKPSFDPSKPFEPVDDAPVNQEEIKAAPTIAGELGQGNIRSAAWLLSDKLAHILEPAQPTSALQVHGKAGESLLGSKEDPFPISGEESQPVTAAKQFGNVLNEFMHGATTPDGIAQAATGGIAALPAMVHDQAVRISEADKTPAGSPERYRAGLSTVLALALPGIFKGVEHVVRPGSLEAKLAPLLDPESVSLRETTPASRALDEALREPAPETLAPEPLISPEPINRSLNQAADPRTVSPAEEIPPAEAGRTSSPADGSAPLETIAGDEPGSKDSSYVALQKAEGPTAELTNEQAAQDIPITEAPLITGDTATAEPIAKSSIPDHLRVDPEIAQLLDSPEAQTGPQMKLPNPAIEGGALFGKGGSTPKVIAKGATPKGDTQFLKIEPGWKRVTKGLEREGAADVIGRSPNKVGQILSKATRKHVDIEQELFGQLSSEFIQATKGLPKNITAKAFDEVRPYLAAKENGRPLPTLSAAAKKLVGAWENIAEKTGQIASANGVQVFDPVTGAHRPMHTMGKDYVPRMMKREVEQVMSNPDSNPKLWNNLVDEFARHRGITDAEAATELRGQASRFASNDFMGNLEMARTGQLPEVFYDYDLRNLASRYLPSFSERMAQIISYGQRLGTRDAPSRPNLWDIARKEAGDTYTQEWLTTAENQATNFKVKGAAATGMARGQTIASGLLLSSPTTTVMRNLLSGVSATPELLGIRRSAKTLVETVKNSQVRMDAREIGAVRDNIGDFLHADKLGESPVDDAVRATVDAGLKYSGYNGSEVFVRSHASLTASQFAKDGVASINKNPASMRSKEALALFKRMGADAEKIVAEGADWKNGPETRKFIRTVIRDTQGGYRFDQVPLWANGNTGRFFYQFGRWGTQRARNIWKNGVQPALGEEVQWNGKTMTRRDVRPLLKMAGGAVLLGETFAGISQVLFGRDRRDASLSEISSAWDEAPKTAVGLAMERMVNDVIMAGTLGIWSQPVDWAKGLKDQSRLKNPAQPPGLGSVGALMDLGQAALDQGTVTRRDLIQFAASAAPGVKQLSDVSRNVLDEPLYEAENDVKTLRAAAHRWALSSGLDVSPRVRGEMRKSSMAPTYEPIKEALLIGDTQRAKFLMEAFLDKQPNPADARKNLKASVKQSQPFRAGPYTSEDHRSHFMAWARTHLSRQDCEQAERVQERYLRAARAVGLWQ